MLFGKVMTFVVARPNVKPAVTRAAVVENTINELMRAVRNGAKTSNAGSKVMSVEAAAESAFVISLDELSNWLLYSTHPAETRPSSGIANCI